MNQYGYIVPGHRHGMEGMVMDEEMSRKRKAKELRQRKRQRRTEEYEFNKCAEQHGVLYKKVEDTQGVKYDCAACKMFVAPYAFHSHTASPEHKNKVMQSQFTEDPGFIERERNFCLQSEREATGAIYCEPCKSYINPSCWDAHISGKKHRAATGQPPLPRSFVVPRADPSSMDIPSTNNPNHTRPVIRSQRLGATSSALLSSFPDQENIPLFCVGEEMWRIDGMFNEASIAIVEEYKTEMSLLDQRRWGSKRAPAMVPCLIYDPAKRALGVCYKLSREAINNLEAARMGDNLALVEVTILVDEQQDRGVAFVLKGHPHNIDIDATANYVASAIGPMGPNYGLLTRIVHELEKQDWKDPYFKRLLDASNRLIWKDEARQI